MIVLGIDAASRSGIAHLFNENILDLKIWEANKDASLQYNLLRFHDYLDQFQDRHPVDRVVVERLAVARNMTTSRKLLYYEAVAILKAAEWRADLVHIVATSARKTVLDKGNLNKEEVYERIKKKFSYYKFLPFNDGGSDQTDALTLALAGLKL